MKQHLGWVMVLALVCTACGGGAETAESTTTSGQGTSSSSSPISSSTTSSTLFIFNEEPPPLENTGEDFEAILTSLFEYRAWLLANPDPNEVSTLFEPGAPAAGSATRIIEEDLAKGRFTSAPGVETPGEVRITERLDTDTVLLFVTKPDLGYTVTNDTGEVFESVEAGPDASFIYELRRSDGRWRIADFTRVDG